MQGPKLSSLTDAQIRQMDWYYGIELRPGVRTAGRRRGSLSLVRHQIKNMDVLGQRCLDIGTQEGVVSTVLAQAGARKVVAYDRLNLSDRISLVQEAYGVDFDYHHSCQLSELPSRLEGTGDVPFDIVIFAGVLYHMIDPLSGMALARSFLRNNGLMLLETSVAVSDEMVMQVNASGRYYQGSNYFQMSLATLDYFLRMLRLQVIDCRHISTAAALENKNKEGVCRVSVVCRAVEDIIGCENDRWLREGSEAWLTSDFEAVSLYFDRLKSDQPPVSYSTGGLRYHNEQGLKTVNLYETVINSPSFPVVREEVFLFLPRQQQQAAPLRKAA